MQPMRMIRTWQIDQLRKAVSILGRLVETTPPAAAHDLRDGGDGWTVTEVMGHLRDFEVVFLERVRLILTQDMPDLPFPNPVELVSERHYNDDDLEESYQAWAAARREHLAMLENVADADWERPSNHPTRGRFTLTDHLLLTAWHDQNHIEQFAHILRQKAG